MRHKFYVYRVEPRIIIFLVVIILLLVGIGIVLFNKNPTGSYNKEEKTMTISESILSQQVLAEVTLESPEVFRVIRGKDRLVAEFTIRGIEKDYDKVFKDMEFFDLKNDKKKIEKDFTYKYKKSVGFETIEDYDRVCHEEFNSFNQTNEEVCRWELVGTHEEEKFEWVILDKKAELPEGELTIGIFTDVSAGESIEWIPTILNIRIEQWAVWTEALDVDLWGYWSLDETTGAVADNAEGNATRDGYAINTDNTDWTTGLIDNALYFDGDAYVNLTNADLLGGYAGEWTLSWWAYINTTNFMGYAGGGVSPFAIYDDTNWLCPGGSDDGVSWDSWQTLCAAAPTALTWTHYVVTKNGNNVSMYKDGACVDSEAWAWTPWENSGWGFSFGRGQGSFTTGALDEIGMWERGVSAAEVTQLYNGGAGIAYGVAPSTAPSMIVNLSEPSNNTLISVNYSNLVANFTFGYMNITNATFYIYNSTNNLWNKTMQSVDPAINGSVLYIGNFSVDTYYWNVKGCGINVTDTICNYSSANSTLVIGITIDAESYAPFVYETSTTKFSVNISLIGTANLIEAHLIYNGSNYSLEKTEFAIGRYELKRELDMPILVSVAEENKTFYWNFNYTDGINLVQNSSVRNQSILPILFGQCNSTLTGIALNFTMFDEKLQTKIDGTATPTDYEANCQYWLGSKNSYKNFSFSSLASAFSNYTFCLNPNNLSLQVDMSSRYDAVGYYEREYSLSNATITNVTSHTTLYLMNSSDAVKFTISVKDGVTNLIGGIITTAKFFTGDGVYKTISISETDNLGQFVIYLELDRDHKFSIVEDGVLRAVINKKSTCLAAPCEITLQIDSDQGNVFAGYEDVYGSSIYSNLSYNATSLIVTYEFVDITGLANYFRLQVYQARYNNTNESGIEICNTYAYSSSGSLNCDVTGYTGDFLAKTYISRSPEKLDKILHFLISELVASMGLLTIIFSLFMVITLCIVGAVISQGDPSVVAFMFGISILGLKLMTMLPFSWGVVGLLELMVILLIAKLRT